MSDEICSKCSQPVLSGRGFQVGDVWYCPRCFVAKAQERRSLTGPERERLRREVKEEFAGLLDRKALRDVIEDGFDRIVVQGEEDDAVFGRMVSAIERMAGLAMCKEMLAIVESMSKEMSAQEAELREKIRRIAEL